MRGGVLFLLMISVAASAAAESVYTLDQCIRFGLEQSTSARRARLEEDIAHTQIGQAGSLALPHVTLGAGYTRLDEVQTIQFGDESIPMGTEDNVEATAGVSQLLYSGGQVGAAWRAAGLLRDAADVARRATEAALVRDIEVQFYGLLLAGEAVGVQEASVEQLRAYAAQVEERRRHGAASEFDELTAKVRLANELPKQIAARNRLELARAAFVRLLNHPGGLVVTGSLERATVELGQEEMEALALARRAEIHGSDIRLGLGLEAIASARSEGRPKLRAFFNYHGANAYQFVSFDDDWQWHWNAGLTLDWDVWDGDLTRQTVRQKKFEYEQLIASDEEVREVVKLEARQAYLELVHAREALEASGESEALALRALEIARTRHASGLSTYLEFTDANLALSTARLARLQARHDHAVAVAQAHYVCGLE